MEITTLTWDSSFFGLRIGKVVVSTEDEAEKLMLMKDQLRDEYDLIYLFSELDIFFHSSSIRPVDKKITYRKILDGTDVCLNSIKEWTSKSITPVLKSLALESGQFSRFKIDSRFPPGSFERLYTKWIEQSVLHVIANHVFCYFVGDVPRGLVTLNTRDQYGNIGLVSVDRKFQMRHIGSDLLHHVCGFAFQQGVRTLFVPTQYANKSACLFYEKMGFSRSTVVNIWHWWL